MANEKMNVTGLNTRTDRDENIASMSLELEISSLDSLGRILARINQLPNVLEVYRDQKVVNA